MKTIELCAKNPGRVGITIRGEPRMVAFEAKHGVGWALVDEDEARKFMEVGGAKGTYWLPGRPTSSEETPAPAETEETPTAVAEAEAPILREPYVGERGEPTLFERYDAVTNMPGLQDLLATVTSVEALMALSQHEVASGGRASYIKAINKRLDALQA